jgi:EH domain-containing protein 1
MQSPGTERLRREVLTTARSKNAAPNEPVDYVYQSLKDIYKTCCRPVEEHYRFSDFFSPPLTDTDIEAKPFVLLLGQYSVGKTTFINHLLGRPGGKGYPGSNVGPEPTTDRFVAIMNGREERLIPGNAAAAAEDKPFHGLQVSPPALTPACWASCGRGAPQGPGA